MFNTFFDSIDRREIRNVEELNFIIIIIIIIVVFWKESARKWNNLWDKFSLVTRRGWEGNNFFSSDLRLFSGREPCFKTVAQKCRTFGVLTI